MTDVLQAADLFNFGRLKELIYSATFGSNLAMQWGLSPREFLFRNALDNIYISSA